jgi:hypothetical protein
LALCVAAETSADTVDLLLGVLRRDLPQRRNGGR